MLNSRSSIVLTLLAALALPATAQEGLDEKPVPPQLLAAEKIFVQQTLIDPRIVSRFRSEIAKWERYEVVASVEEADLVAILSAEVAYTQTVAESESASDDGTGETSRSSADGVRPLGTVRTLNDVHLSISIPDGDEVWTDVVPVTGMSGGAAKRLVKRLRGRVEDES